MADLSFGLNAQQISAVRESTHLSLVSCPGSGKTRTIVAKLLACLEEVRGTPRKVGCITYTTAAAYEIERRLRRAGGGSDEGRYEVGTIHSFCLRSIIRPFGHFVDPLSHERAILPPDCELFEELVAGVVENFGLHRRAATNFQNIGYQPDGTLILPHDITERAARAFLDEVADRSLMTFADLLWRAREVIVAEPFVAQAIGSRFAWLLVDEFQDTTALQVEILREIAAAGRTRMFLVGDPNQSIYGFAGARPDLMEGFAWTLGARRDIALYGNYRSSARVVAFAERICPLEPAMQAVGPQRDWPAEPAYYHVSTPFDGVTQLFLPALVEAEIGLGEAAILAPTWWPLYHLGRQLRDAQIPIIGPGARPYRRGTVFAPFAEEIGAYFVEESPERAVRVERAFFFMLLDLTRRPDDTLRGLAGRQVLVRILRSASTLRCRLRGATEWLTETSLEVARILQQEKLIDEQQARIIVESAESMIQGIGRNLGEEASQLTVDDLGFFARARESLRLLTMHSAKGREFDAVALVDIHDGRIPFFLSESEAEIAEARRLFYVAATRARKVLMLFTDSSNWRNEPSRFLREIGLV